MTDKEKQTFLKEFGCRVKQHRIEKEMSQEELANLVGYTSDNARSSIQKIESGKSDLPASKIRILAEVLDIPVEKLMGWDHKKPTEENLQEWDKKYNPGGKLPVCVARNAGQIPVYYNHQNGSAWHQELEA